VSCVIPADTITAANEANTAKEKALADVSALKLEAERQHAAFEEEWKQLTRFIEDDRCELVLITAEGHRRRYVTHSEQLITKACMQHACRHCLAIIESATAVAKLQGLGWMLVIERLG
jgi:hypothetical protein